MLGRNLPQGSEAISFHNTLFRVSELCWVKAVRLSIPEWIVRGLALVLAVAWVVVMKNAKGSYTNVEFLLAGFPLLLAWSMSGSLKIGCSGDFEEAYDSRRGILASPFMGWIETLRKKEPDWLHLKSGNYDLLLNPNRVAWIRPCVQWSLYPLVVVAAFVGYLFLVDQNVGAGFENFPVIEDFQILIFANGVGSVRTLSYLIMGVALAAFALSVKRSVEICGTGGVQDVFPLTSADQQTVLGILAGSDMAARKATVPSAPASQGTPASKAAKPKKEAPSPRETAEKPTTVLADVVKQAEAPAASASES